MWASTKTVENLEGKSMVPVNAENECAIDQKINSVHDSRPTLLRCRNVAEKMKQVLETVSSPKVSKISSRVAERFHFKIHRREDEKVKNAFL